MTAETLVWADGRPGWEPLRSVPELWEHASTAAQPPAASQPATAAPPGAFDSAAAPAMQPAGGAHLEAEKPGAGSVAQQPSRRKAAVVAKAAPAKAAPEDNELAAFQAEMSALGAVAAPGPDVEDPLRAETPEPEDRRFQDDDGTWYIWDALLRKFVEEVRYPFDDAQHDGASGVTEHLWLPHIVCCMRLPHSHGSTRSNCVTHQPSLSRRSLSDGVLNCRARSRRCRSTGRRTWCLRWRRRRSPSTSRPSLREAMRRKMQMVLLTGQSQRMEVTLACRRAKQCLPCKHDTLLLQITRSPPRAAMAFRREASDRLPCQQD